MANPFRLPLLLPSDPDYEARVLALKQLLAAGGLVALGAVGDEVPSAVARILAEVRARGDLAARELTQKFDRAALGPGDLLVPQTALQAAHAQAEPQFLALVRRAIANIRQYQEHILQRAPAPLERGGRRLGVRYSPIDRVGVYVPGGKALYPSTVLMTVVPAQVARVREIVMVSPPTGGDIHPLALALACELGITEVYRLGGAVAVAALAYGTESIARVDKIVGPGNAYVAEAKRQLFGQVGIDSIAGPSEVLIVADASVNAAYVAADLLAQAEHNPGSAILLTPSEALARAVSDEVARQLSSLERAPETRAALERYSALIVTPSLDAACEWVNRFAPEHLQLMTSDNQRCLGLIRHAGAIFVGPDTAVPLGDYYAGPSHVLPTGGTARFFGALSCNDFLKATSVIEYDHASLEQDAPDVVDFATREGLTAHALAIAVRRETGG